MNIALWIQTVSTIVIAFFAYRMWGNAEANLKNAAAMKELEETSLKIAIWEELKEIMVELEKYTANVYKGNKLNTFPDIYAKIHVVQYAPYFARESDELLSHMEKLGAIGETLQSRLRDLYVDNKLNLGGKRERVSKLNNMIELLKKESTEITKILQSQYTSENSIHESWIKRLLIRLKISK